MARLIRLSLFSFMAGCILYILSLVGFVYPLFNYLVFIVIVFAAAYASFRWRIVGSIIILSELIIGGKGYLFHLAINDYVLPVRYIIFAVVLASWLFWSIKDRRIYVWHSPYRWSLAFLGLVLLIGAAIGYLNNPRSIWFFDLNGYLFLLAALPFLQGIRNSLDVKRVLGIGAGFLLSLFLLTVVVFMLFGTAYYSSGLVNSTLIDQNQQDQLRQIGDKPENARLGQGTSLSAAQMKLNQWELSSERPLLYRWLRDKGVAEVSYISSRFFRVFSISHLFFIPALFILVIKFCRISQIKSRESIFLSALVICSFLVIFIGYSRSFWLGILSGFLVLPLVISRVQFRRLILRIYAPILIVVSLALFVFPQFYQLYSDRVTSLFSPEQEVAASNRMQLLPEVISKIKSNPIIGHGFGTLVTYPAVLAGTDKVEYIKVYLYEWTYLDIAVKLGAVGIIAFAVLIIHVLAIQIKRLINHLSVDSIKRGLLISLLCFVVLNIFTPFLNHPIGIGLLLLTATLFTINDDETWKDPRSV